MLDTIPDTKNRANKDRLCCQETLTSELDLWNLKSKENSPGKEAHTKREKWISSIL